MSAEQVENGMEGAATQVAADGKLTVCLTDRVPVRIVEANWPIVAKTVLPIYRIEAGQVEAGLHAALKASLELPARRYHGSLEPDHPLYMCNPREEHDSYVTVSCYLGLTVRRHADGRLLIQGQRSRSQVKEQDLADALGGEFLEPGTLLAPVLEACAKRFVSMCGGGTPEAPKRLSESCLAQVSATHLDDRAPDPADAQRVELGAGRSVWVSKTEWPSIVNARVGLTYIPRVEWYEEGMAGDEAKFSGISTGAAMSFGEDVLTVFANRDGRHLVSGYRRYVGDRVAAFDIFNERCGEVVPADGDLVAAIKRVGAAAKLGDEAIRACINGLPAQDVD